eukprot:8961863-Ditylum_brightwellii.AAC.1
MDLPYHASPGLTRGGGRCHVECARQEAEPEALMLLNKNLEQMLNSYQMKWLGPRYNEAMR